jgi:hypothetical protein
MSTETKPNIVFSGTIPKIYDEVLGPVYFEPYAIDLAERVAKPPDSDDRLAVLR